MMSLAKISVLTLLCRAFSGVYGGQVPVVEGVIGGVPGALEMAHLRGTQSRLASAGSVNVTRTPGKLRVVENSGICETTQNVYQASGYGDINSDGSIWFWFFAARESPDTAPLTLWFNGGPGSSSMIGLLQEHGPCRITNDSVSVTLNSFSWNNDANMLYIDQPIGTGFSHGNSAVSTSQEAASDIWTFMQIFLSDSRFSKYQNNDLAIWTESYGGHYGPTFAAWVLSALPLISSHKIPRLRTEYAANNSYHPLVSLDVIQAANTSWSESGGCESQISECYSGNNDTVCSDAQDFCNSKLLLPLAGNFDLYYVPTKNPDPYPADIVPYLNSVRDTIGADVSFTESSDDVYVNFALSGDWMRNSRPDLETVINAGVRTLIYDGDADYILNFRGVEAMVDNLNTQFTATYKQQEFQQYIVAGQTAGQFKSAGNFSYIRVFGAGHEVPAYKFGMLDYGQAAAQMFTQTMTGKPLASGARKLSLSPWIRMIFLAWFLY